MKAIITVDRNTALMAGLDNEGDYTISFSPSDLSDAQRAELSRSAGADGAYLVNQKLLTDSSGFTSSKYTGMVPPVASPDIDTMRLLLDARIAVRAKMIEDQRLADIEIVERYIGCKTDEELVGKNNYGDADLDFWVREWGIKAANSLGDQATLARIERIRTELIPMRQAEIAEEWAAKKAESAREEAEREAEEARKKAEKKAAAERRTAQLSAWIAEHGTDNQRGRLAEGVLPETEIVDAIREQVFAPLAGEPRYVKLTAVDVRAECTSEDEIDPHEVAFNVTPKETLTAAEYDRLIDLRKLMPGAEITVRSHNGWCKESNCEADIYRTSYRVKITLGELELSREYGD